MDGPHFFQDEAFFFIHPKFTKRFFAVSNSDLAAQTHTHTHTHIRVSCFFFRDIQSETQAQGVVSFVVVVCDPSPDFLSPSCHQSFFSSHPQSRLDDDRENVHRSCFQKLGLNRILFILLYIFFLRFDL